MDTWDDAAQLITSPRQDQPDFGAVSVRSGTGWDGATSPRQDGGWGGVVSPRGPGAQSSGLPGDYQWEAFNQQYVVPFGAQQVYQGKVALAKAVEDAATAEEMARTAAENPVGGADNSAWSVQNQWNGDYSRSAASTGVPANMIKAIQGLETGRADYTGQENCDLRKDDQGNPNCVALNSGIFKSTADAYGLDYEQIRDDPAYAIQAIGVVLQNVANSDAGQWGGTPGKTVLEEGGWLGVARVYHGGQINGGFVDENGVSSLSYENDINRYLQELGGIDAGVTDPGEGYTPPAQANQTDRTVFSPVLQDGTVDARPKSGTTNINSIWGSDQVKVDGEMGSDFLVQRTGDEHIYDYAEEFGYKGNPGVDYDIPVGTDIYSPISGTIVNVGGDFYKDPYGVGEVRIQADNGDIIILGNMRTADFKTGDTIEVGDLIGTSGQYDMRPDSNGLHLEVRVKQPDGTYRVAHPEEYFSPPTTTNVTPPGKSTADVVNNDEGKAIADLADNYNGVAYVLGSIPTAGQDPYQTGWDCSGFVFNIADQLGISKDQVQGGIPRGSHYQAQWAMDTDRWVEGNDISKLQPGDIIFFDTGAEGGGGQNEVSQEASRATHVGIYLGDGKMINAMQECQPGMTMGVDCGTGTVDVTDPYWHERMLGSATMY